MRIGIDGYYTASSQFGFTSYISRIVDFLSRTGEDELTLYVPDTPTASMAALARLPRVEVRAVEFGADGFPDRLARDTTWHQKALPQAARGDGPDVLFGTCQFVPLEWDGPCVVTVHDLIFERYPEFFTPVNLELYRTWTRASCERADAVLTVSESSAVDVREIYGVAAERVVTTPLAAALPFLPSDRAESARVVRAELGVEPGYVLSVAASHPRKNLEGAVRAYAAVSPDVPLLLANLDAPRVREMVDRHGVSDRTTFTGKLPEDLIPHVYAAASVLLYPSFCEGFGIPVLEAMSCGTPVIGSDRPSIPEVAGEAAVLVDPLDDAGIADALRTVLTDPELRTRLSSAGRERAAGFDWERTARTTRQVLASVAR